MKSKAFFAAIAIAAGGMVVPPAMAGTISIGTSTDGVTITTQMSGSPGVAWTGSVDGFSLNLVTGGDLNPIDLSGTSSNSAQGASGPIYIYVSETGLSAPGSTTTFHTGFTENDLSPGWSVIETSWLDNGNAPYGLTTQLGTDTFTSNGVADENSLEPVGASFSVTEEFVITASGAGSADSTMLVTTVPEPSTWAMLGLGFAGLGLLRMTKPRRKDPRYAV